MALNTNPKEGFILLEALIAMTLIVTSWVGLSHAYQGLALRFGQLQEKRVQIGKESDQFEIHIHSLNNAQQGSVNEPSRLLHRASPELDAGKSVTKNQRRTGSKTN
jgi:Tfp pilus assembly protein PilV